MAEGWGRALSVPAVLKCLQRGGSEPSTVAAGSDLRRCAKSALISLSHTAKLRPTEVPSSGPDRGHPVCRRSSGPACNGGQTCAAGALGQVDNPARPEGTWRVAPAAVSRGRATIIARPGRGRLAASVMGSGWQSLGSDVRERGSGLSLRHGLHQSTVASALLPEVRDRTHSRRIQWELESQPVRFMAGSGTAPSRRHRGAIGRDHLKCQSGRGRASSTTRRAGLVTVLRSIDWAGRGTSLLTTNHRYDGRGARLAATLADRYGVARASPMVGAVSAVVAPPRWSMRLAA